MVERVKEIDNLHIVKQEELPSPQELKAELVLEGGALATVLEGHRAVKAVLDREDPRLIVVVLEPERCWLQNHNRQAALSRPSRLKSHFPYCQSQPMRV